MPVLVRRRNLVRVVHSIEKRGVTGEVRNEGQLSTGFVKNAMAHLGQSQPASNSKASAPKP